MAGSKMWAIVMLGLLAMVQQSMQFSIKNPLPFRPREIRNDVVIPAFGLITTTTAAEKALNDTGLFSVTASTVIAGRTILIGTIYATPAVLLRTSTDPSVNVGISVQILADNFNIRGIVHFGTAGASNNTFKLGTVSVPAGIAYTGDWTWLDKDSNEQGQLDISRFNVNPSNGENLLGSIEYNEVDIYYKKNIIESYWIYPTARWLMAASRLQAKSDGVVVVGFNHSSSDIYVKNPAYREFLYKTFRVSTLDKSSAAAGLGAKANVVNFISLVGVSNYAGWKEETASALANKNVAEAVIGLIWELTVPRSANEVAYF